MKRARPPLPAADLDRPDALLTTGDVARLLRVHPKHVYRLLRRGLPGHRVGGEWRFGAAEVQGWYGADAPAVRNPGESVPPLVAANGDLAVERLLARLGAGGEPPLGHVQADRTEGLELLRSGSVLAAGYHGSDIPTSVDDQGLAFIHIVDREVGLALRRGVRLPSLKQIGRLRLASRPRTAGVRSGFDEELRRQGIDPRSLHARAAMLTSHREVVCAVARGEADVGLASFAWARRVGLDCVPLCRENYGILVRASLLGDPRILRLCGVAQSRAFKREIGAIPGYDARLTGTISYPSRTKHSS